MLIYYTIVEVKMIEQVKGLLQKKKLILTLPIIPFYSIYFKIRILFKNLILEQYIKIQFTNVPKPFL